MPILLEAAVRSAMMAAVMWVVLKALRVRDAHAEKLVWTLWVAGSLAMPVLMRTAALPLPATASVTMAGSDISARLLSPSDHPAFTTALVGLYLIIAGVLSLRFLMSLHGAFRLYRQARPRATELDSGIDLRTSDAVRAPCTFAGCILLPAEFETWAPAARAAVLAHERSHVIHRDCFRLWLATVYSCVFWFNPAAWLVRRRLQLLAELTSDQEAVRCAGDSAAYAEMLVRIAARSSPVSAALAMSGTTQLTARIHRIMENDMISRHLGTGRKVMLTGASFLAAVLCSCTGGPHVLSQAEDPKVPWVSGEPLGQFYPAALRDNHVEGYVVMRLALDQSGRVTDANVLTEDPKGAGLGSAALNAARTFRFDNTLAKPVIKTMQIRFALRD